MIGPQGTMKSRFDTSPKEKLDKLFCPECKESQPSKEMKLKVNATYSQLTCKHCKEVTSTSRWRCECKTAWYKCSLHVQDSKRQANTSRASMKRKACNQGVEAPMPGVRRIGVANEGIVAEPSVINLIPLQPGICPKLAARFPTFTRKEQPSLPTM